MQRIEYIHSKNFVHRDIKPDNFLMGIGKKQNTVYAIDFGLAKRFRDPKTGDHIPYRDGKDLTGTARYASVNTHLGIEQSRRDDLEALGFVLMYFNRGSLPWQGLAAKTKKEKYDKIREKKVTTTVEALCKGYPEEFGQYLDYCRKLPFDEKPDYALLRKLFKDLFVKKGFEYDYVYDWLLPKPASKPLPPHAPGGPMPPGGAAQPANALGRKGGVILFVEESKKTLETKDTRPEAKAVAHKDGSKPTPTPKPEPVSTGPLAPKGRQAHIAPPKPAVMKPPVRIVKDGSSGAYSKTSTNGLSALPRPLDGGYVK